MKASLEKGEDISDAVAEQIVHGATHKRPAYTWRRVYGKAQALST